MHEGPRVSIVTPSLNSADHLAETLDSVLTQDYQHIEYLVVDGGSTDGTVDTLRRYGGRVRWVSEPDAGQSNAINKGWRMAGGEIIGWINADDIYRPGAVRAAVEALAADPTADAIFGDCDYLDEAGMVIGRYPVRSDAYVTLISGRGNCVPQPTVFLRRRVLETVGFLDEALHYVMDLDYWLRLAVHHRMIYLPRVLAGLRLHADAKSVRAIVRFGPELIQVYERLFRRPDLPPQWRRWRRVALSTVSYTAAGWAFKNHDFRSASRFALAAWRHSPVNGLKMVMGTAARRLRGEALPWRPAPDRRQAILMMSSDHTLEPTGEPIVEHRVPTVAFVCASTLRFGGVETHISTLIAGIPRHDLRFVVVAPVETRFGKEVSSLGAAVLPWHPRGRFDWRAGVALYRTLKRERVDLVHIQDPRAGLVGRCVTRLLGISVIYTIHVAPYDYIEGVRGVNPLKVWVYRRIEAFLNHRLTDRVVYVSRNTCRRALASGLTPPERTLVIENGIDVEPFLRETNGSRVRLETGTPADAVVICFAGRISWQKGLDVLADALHILAAGGARFRVWLAGDGPMRPELEARLGDLGLRTHVAFLGFQADLTGVLGESDLFVLPSRYEGMPFALLQAMAAGRASVVTDVGDNSLLVEDGIQGFVVPPNDARALAMALLRLVDSPRLREQMGERSREKARAYSVDRMLAQSQATYAGLVRDGRLSARAERSDRRNPRAFPQSR